MSDDPETVRQIGALAMDDRPLLVVDVDDVVLDFLPSFQNYLLSREFELSLTSFRLHGNIRGVKNGFAASDEEVSRLIDDFFRNQADWQKPMDGVANAFHAIGESAAIVLLTAMPHRHHETRRLHLDRLALPYPLLTTETPKGPAVAMLRGPSQRSVAFVDDIPRNLLSVREAVPDVHLFHLMASDHLRGLLPPLAEGIIPVRTWRDAVPLILEALRS